MIKLFRISYKWFNSWEYTWKNVTGIFYDIKHGFENLIEWFPIIWEDRDWDWGFLAFLMSFKLRKMANLHEKYGNHLHKERAIRQMRICAKLLERLRGEEYEHAYEFKEDGSPVDPKKFHRAWKKVESLHKQDMELFCTIFGKHLKEWWD